MTAPKPKQPTRAQILEAVMQKTGLSRNTVKELLKQGWTYREGNGVPPMFTHPSVAKKSFQIATGPQISDN